MYVHNVPHETAVVIRGAGAGFAQEISVRRHRLTSDEPVADGGTDTGPTPYDLLLAALGSCASMTVALYAGRKEWSLKDVIVRLQHSRIHAEDCAECETKSGRLDRIQWSLQVDGDLTAAQRNRLLEIAQMCPIHRTLRSEVYIAKPVLIDDDVLPGTVQRR